MDCTDEVWVAGKEETSIALMDFEHGGGVQVLAWVEFAKNWGVSGVSTRVKTLLLYPHQGYLAKTGLIQQSYQGYFQATTP